MKKIISVIIICLFALNSTNAQESDTTIFLLDSTFYEMVDSDYEDFLEYTDSNYYLIENADSIKYYSSNTVFISFIVETDGSITNVKQAKNTFCTNEKYVDQAIEYFKQIPKWDTENMQDTLTKTTYVIPVNFD